MSESRETELRRAVMLREGPKFAMNRERAIRDTAEKFGLPVEEVRAALHAEEDRRRKEKTTEFHERLNSL